MGINTWVCQKVKREGQVVVSKEGEAGSNVETAWPEFYQGNQCMEYSCQL